MPVISEPSTDMDNNFLSYRDPFTDTQQENGQSSVMPTTIDGLISRSMDPRVFTQSPTNGIVNSSNMGLLQRTAVFIKASPPVVPHTPQPRVLIPSKYIPIISSNSVWCNVTYASESAQRSADQRPELKSHRKYGCRFGPLKPDILKHARKIRKVRACWSCRFSKVTVS
jgi:hypothetical protein